MNERRAVTVDLRKGMRHRAALGVPRVREQSAIAQANPPISRQSVYLARTKASEPPDAGSPNFV